MPSQPVRYRWRLLRAGEFRLDGGSMFGLIPRSVWSRSVQTDDKNRITVQHNCLLLERVDSAGAAPGPKLALIEVGTGDKLDPASKDLFAMSDRTILTALHEADCAPEDIGAVVTTHLHFDHAGGMTRMANPGETPDWHGPASGMAGARPDHAVRFSFPNAVFFAQEREWNDALANRSVMTRTYFKDHLDPFARAQAHAQIKLDAAADALRERLCLVDSPRPFPTGYTPDRDELPRTTIEQRATHLPGLPGVRVLICPGHTFGQQAILFDDDQGRTVVFVPDVMPTAAHLGAAYSLAYDVEPYTSMISKRWLLTEAAARNWTLVLDHEPANPCKLVKANAKGWFDLIDSDLTDTNP
jgi:glyoxylase-like metal-dependent hydrolase (beta-lactamase superfamily II)